MAKNKVRKPKIDHSKHNPVLNGKTKIIVMIATITVGVLTLVGLIILAYIAIQDIGFFGAWKTESILGTFDMAGMSCLTGLIFKFMDTRSTQEKDKTKLEIKKINSHNLEVKYDHRLEKYKIKVGAKSEHMRWDHKQEEIITGMTNAK